MCSLPLCYLRAYSDITSTGLTDEWRMAVTYEMHTSVTSLRNHPPEIDRFPPACTSHRNKDLKYHCDSSTAIMNYVYLPGNRTNRSNTLGLKYFCNYQQVKKLKNNSVEIVTHHYATFARRRYVDHLADCMITIAFITHSWMVTLKIIPLWWWRHLMLIVN